MSSSDSDSDRDLKNAHQDLLSYARHNRVEAIEKALSSKKSKLDVNFQDEDGNTAPHFAVKRGHKEVVEKALSSKKSKLDVNFQDEDGNTAPHFAVKRGHEEVVEKALSSKKSKLDVNFQDEDGNTALHFAVKRGYKKVVDILLGYGADANIKNGKGKSSLDLIDDQLKKTPNDDNLKKIKESLENSRRDTSLGKNDQQIPRNPLETVENRISRSNASPLKKPQITDNTFHSTDNSIHGIIFQIGIIMLFARRAKKMGYEFRLASEMDAAEKFDDVVFEHIVGNELCWSFVQAKHKRNDTATIKSDELQEIKDKAPFSIPKYFLSFVRINRNFENKYKKKNLKDFVIVTNANFDCKATSDEKDKKTQKWDDLLEENSLNHDDILYLEGFDVKRYQLRANDDELKSFIKGNLLASALKSKNIPKFPAAQRKLKEQSKEIKGNAGKSLNPKKVKSEEDQTDSASLEMDKQKLKDIVTKCNEHRETIRNGTDIEHVIRKMEGDTVLKEFIHPTTKESVKVLDILMTISELSIIEVALDDAAFDEYFTEFVQKFRFVTNFPNEEKLEAFNKSLLSGDHYNLSNVDLVYSAFIERFLNLMNCKEGENVYYTPQFEDELLSAINGFFTSGISMSYCADLDEHKIHFDEKLSSFSELSTNLNEFLNEEQQEWQGIYLRTRSTLLSAIKVLQILKRHGIYKNKDGFILIPFKKLSQDGIKQLVFDALRNRKSHDLLVIYFEDEKTLISINEQVKTILDELLNKELPKKKRIILIGMDSNNSGLEFQETNDSTSFNDLDEESQNVVLGTEVNFQGTTMSLNRLIDRNYGAKFFDEESLARLLNGNQLKIGDENAFSSNGYVKEYYIKRTFRRQRIKKDILKNEVQLFFITAMKKEGLATLDEDLLEIGAPKESIVQWTDEYVQNTKWNKGIILPPPGKSNEELYEIIQRLAKNVHWLELHRGVGLFWKLSTGDISLITESIDNDFVFELEDRFYDDEDLSESESKSESKEVVPDEHHFCNVKQFGSKVVILANEAGMGKSTVLTSMAKKMRELNENEVKWIVRINVNDYANDFKKNYVERAIDFVAKMAIPGDATKNIDIKIQRTLFKSSLERKKFGLNLKEPKIVLMFDGFDEICPDHESNTTKLIKALKDSEVAQIWVTTRAHEQDHLQKELGSLAYTLNPLTEKDQQTFLDKYWKWKLTVAEEKPSNYQEILDHLNIRSKSDELLIDDINKFDFSTQSDNILHKWNRAIFDKNRKFTTVPLLLQMLADVTLGMKFILPEKNGLLNLYDQFIEIKFKIFFDDKTIKAEGNVQTLRIYKKLQRNECTTYNALAVDRFFPNDKSLPGLNLLEGLADETQKSIDERKHLMGTGLLISKGNKLAFIHQSFAEYFFSRYLIENVSNEEVQKLLCSKIFRDDIYGLICQFFNDQIEKLPESKKQIKLTDAAMESILKFKNKGSPFFVHIIKNGYHGICKLFLKSIRHDNELHKKNFKESLLQTDDDGRNVLHCAFIKGDTSIINIILDSIRQYPDIRQKLLLRSNRRGENPLYKLSTKKTSAESHDIIKALTTGIGDDEFFEDLATFTAFSRNVDVVRDNIKKMLEIIGESVPKLHEKYNEIQKNFDKIKQKRAELVNAILSHDENQNSRTLDMLDELRTGNFERKQILLSIDDHGTILHEAIRHGKTDIIKKILENLNNYSEHFGLEFLLKRSHKWNDGTALHLAACGGQREVVELLIEKGADVDEKDIYGLTSLHWSAAYGQREVALILIDHNADVCAKTNTGRTALHDAANEGQWDVIQLLIEKGADVDEKDIYGYTPLHWTADRGQSKDVKLLIGIGAKINEKDIDRRTPLYCAVMKGQKEIVQLLIENKADVHEKDKDGRTPLHWAAVRGHMEIVQLLIENKADVHEKDKDGRTPLHWAAVRGHEDIVQLLIEKGADVDEKDIYGLTSLHWSAAYGQREVALILIDHNADVCAKTNTGRTALHDAANEGQWDVIQLLIEKGADVDEKDIYGLTPLHWTADRGQSKDVKLLIGIGAKINEKDNDRRTPLHCAVTKGHMEIVQLLIENKADVHEKDKDGRTPLHWAAVRGHKEILQLLIENKADVNEKDNDGATPLHLAATNGHEEIVQLLIKNKADVNEKDNDGATPLHLAATNGHEEIVQLLIKNKADVNEKDNDGKTPLHWAYDFGLRKIIQLLIEKSVDVTD